MKKYSYPTSLLSVLLIIPCFSIAFGRQNRTCNPQDFITLTKINAALGIGNPPGNCCDWNFVVCDSHPPFPVIELNYIDNPNISGQIPAAVSDLRSLVSLQFIAVPNLTGNLPLALTKLPLLNHIYIFGTGLSGPIPSFLTNIRKLVSLDLKSNSFTGSIPPELPQSPKLNSLDLSGNKLTGNIPESFGNFKGDNFMFLSLANNNFLTGTIPKSLGNLSNLLTIDLSGNRFSGDPSFLFDQNKIPGFVLNLDNNNFSFDISNVTFPQSISILNLSHNRIFGSLPTQLTQLFTLTQFDVSNNQLCGQIPQGGQLQTFGIDTYANNKCLCGAPLPACK